MLFERYEFFLEIVQHSSITKAAESMMISQSALSKYLRSLEESLGARLIDRSTIPIQLTRSGELFYHYLLRFKDSEKQMLTRIQELSSDVEETIRIGLGPWRASCFLPDVLPAFQTLHPNVRVEIMEDVSDSIASALQNRKIDIAILGNAQLYPFLNSIHLADERILLACSNFHPIATQVRMDKAGSSENISKVNLNLFSQDRVVMTSSRQGFARRIEQHFDQVHYRPSEVIRITNLNTGLYLAAKGGYISFVPEIVKYSLALPENLSFFTFGEPIVTYPIMLVWNHNAVLSRGAKLFSEAVLNFYHKLETPSDACLSLLSDL